MAKMLRVLIVLALLPLLVYGGIQWWVWRRNSQPCASYLPIGPASYWEWVKTKRAIQVHEVGDSIHGKLADEPDKCFVIGRDAAFADSEQRAEGYRRALTVLALTWASHRNFFGDAKEQLRQITGRTFKNGAEARCG
jgi:hypothetical protein